MKSCPVCQSDNIDNAQFCFQCGTNLADTGLSNLIATGMLPTQMVLQERYVIEEKLGQGGMGAVYRASDRRLSTVNWAIKEMSSQAITSPLERQQVRESFRNEAEMLAALAHPNLPRVIDHFEQDGKAYLVMEFVPGDTLISYVQQEGLPQPLSRVLSWVRQLCDVLTYLHTSNPPIIFRDLKPANIMLTPQGQLKLIDFGIARLFKPGKEKDTQAFGTAGYSAPEQYGRGQTDARSDVYSLGVLVHQLVTGYDPTQTPFRLPFATELQASISREVSEVLSKAVDNDPAQRFTTIHEFRDALFRATEQTMASTQAVAPHIEPGTIYSRPATPSYPPATSGVYGAENTVTYQPPAPVQQTTVLASASRWLGIASGIVMGIAVVVVLAGVLIETGDDTPIQGFGIIIGMPALVTGPIASTMAVIALATQQTAHSKFGRRHALIGFVTGAITILFCCVILFLAGATDA
ncbi:MAG: Serine/threonine protein kinase [Chloroflexi bacterium AL-N1]|nr:Serine/threonine protein kinase [Chloroflexi bacterium AL-N1]NOK92217.1 Serine/threonine protein kinase [Chloroflexi bacterium AL-N15]